MSMDTAREQLVFEHELLGMYGAEQRLTKALPKMAKQTTDEKLRRGFKKHGEQTKQHVERIEQACALLRIKPEAETCPGMAGLIKEHDTFLKENPSASVLTLFLMGAAQKTEHYEMVGYQALISMARTLDENDAAKQLSETLKEEEQMASELEQLENQNQKHLAAAAS
jgi:ferritin-like metal-binding protein YciE